MHFLMHTEKDLHFIGQMYRDQVSEGTSDHREL